jgi:hypothetical protein
LLSELSEAAGFLPAAVFYRLGYRRESWRRILPNWERGGYVKSEVTNRQITFLLFLTLTTYTIINIPKVMA